MIIAISTNLQEFNTSDLDQVKGLVKWQKIGDIETVNGEHRISCGVPADVAIQIFALLKQGVNSASFYYNQQLVQFF